MKTLLTPEKIAIVSYKPEYAPYFDRYNRDWLEEYFEVEPIDKYVLENPEEAILQKGGRILFAEHEGQIIGTVALKFAAPGVYELTKMAVAKTLRGQGAGKILCSAAIEEAKRLSAHTLILYSQTQLANAIGIYRKLGFKELPLEPGVYKRADIKMALYF
jgi:ribosomal protein S18 acetylase RimI-like enzyme